MNIRLYDYNKEAYENVKKHLEKSNKTCVIHPTGTGKSFISLKFLFDNKDKKCLFMAPTDAIVQQIKTHIEDSNLTMDDFPNLEFCLYASADKIKEKKYDYIVFDEFHRIGADIWGSNVKTLIDNNKDAKILGVSATPVRYLDDNRNMAEEIFDNDIASHLTLAEAIVKKILPTPNYIGSIISLQSDIDKIQKQIDNYVNKEEAKEYQKILDKAKKMLENSDGLDVIFNKNIQNKNGKFIVFCRNYEHMLEMEEKCKEWFKKVNKNIEISDVYSVRGQKINQKAIKDFEKNNSDSIKLLFSIEMLNEGLHVKDIDGVIMFRPTESPIIYLQQLGRSLSVGHNDNPLIFDIVNNFGSLDSIVDLKNEVKELIDEIIEERKKDKEILEYPSNDELTEVLNRFKILEENKNIIEILKELETDTVFTWNDWYALAKEYYEKYGDLNVPMKYVTKNGENLGIWIRAQRQAKEGNSMHKITEEQIDLLNKIDMIWDAQYYRWIRMYYLAKEYYKIHGNLNIPSDFVTENGENLGLWIRAQRQAKEGNSTRKITEEQIHMLEEIGMVWNVYDHKWEKMYLFAKEYYEKYGNLNIPSDYVTKSGENLGKWIQSQRKIKNGSVISTNLTEDKMKMLDDIGMIWNLLEYNWMKMYDFAKEYYEKHGNLNIPIHYVTENGENLGLWIKSQRTAKNSKKTDKKITDEKIKMLDDIGMRWENIYLIQGWMEKYEAANRYYNEYGNLEIPRSYITPTGFKLGQWIGEAKRKYRGNYKSKITQEQIKLLEQIDIVWFSSKEDYKLQSEEITKKNILIKQKEILNRFYSLISKYDENELPSKEELNKRYIKQLNREE